MLLKKFEIDHVEDRGNYHVTLLRVPMVTYAGTYKQAGLTAPLALAYLSACLKEAGFSVSNIDALGEGVDHIGQVVTGLDLDYQGLTTEEIIGRLDPKTKLLGVSCMFSNEWTHARSIIKAIKARFPDLTIIVGGEHASAVPEIVLEDCPEIDCVVLGEGEEAIVDVAECFRINGNLNEVTGVVFKDSGDLVETSPRARIRDIDAIPRPAWDLLPLEVYLESREAKGIYNVRIIPMLASRGCPYECTFCSNPVMYGRYYATRDPNDVLDEIQFYIDEYNIEDVDFYDLTTITKKKWIHEFCDLIIKRNMKFIWRITGGTRTEAIDEEVLRKAKQAGCRYLGFAPESGSETVLTEIKKMVDLKRMYHLFKVAKKIGIATKANFILGFPRETRWQMYATLFLQFKLSFVGVEDAPIYEFVPYPGSEDANYLVKNGVIEMNDEYFDSLCTNYSLKNRKEYCENVGPTELHFYRVVGMVIYYLTFYILRPHKLYGFVKNLFGDGVYNSLFEQRTVDNLILYKKKLKSLSKA